MGEMWDLYCHDCDVWFGHEGKFTVDGYAAALAERPALEAVAHLGVLVSVDCVGDVPIPGWLKSHGGHRIAVRSEYGRDWGVCGYRFRCPCCGKEVYCRSPVGHEGDHEAGVSVPGGR